MKDALSWLNEVGESVGRDIFCGDKNKPGSRSEKLIRAIQADALREAANIVRGTPAMFFSPSTGFVPRSQTVDLIESKAKQLEDDDGPPPKLPSGKVVVCVACGHASPYRHHGGIDCCDKCGADL